MSDERLISLDKSWKTQTVSANVDFHEGAYDRAIEAYRQTMEFAKQLNENGERCANLKIPYVQIFIISCNNLANTYEERGQLKASAKMLTRAIYFVRHLFSVLSEDDAHEQHLHSELKRATLAYCNFCKRKKLRADVAIMDIQSQSDS